MSSRFVAAGTDQTTEPPPAVVDDGWSKARQQVESSRVLKPDIKGQQDDGKSLYEVLQANKAAKQQAFEESAKLRNQFRALDDSEVEFLESVHESERSKDDATKRETAEQLEVFRKQRAAAEQAALQAAQTQNNADGSDKVATGSWTSSKKKRRLEKAEEVIPMAKQRKASTAEDERKPMLDLAEMGIIAKSSEESPSKKDTDQASMNLSKPATASALGLGAYSSDDDD